VKAVKLIAAFHAREIDCPRSLLIRTHGLQRDDGRGRAIALGHSIAIWVQAGSSDP
jgi:hypothetical protein